MQRTWAQLCLPGDDDYVPAHSLARVLVAQANYIDAFRAADAPDKWHWILHFLILRGVPFDLNQDGRSDGVPHLSRACSLVKEELTAAMSLLMEYASLDVASCVLAYAVDINLSSLRLPDLYHSL
ncbi:MAG: hypothetical protein MHM6MM_005433 [Cercozoa sp. M6MM]